MNNKFLFIITLFVIFSSRINGQIDLSVLGVVTLDLEVFSDGEKININSPILLKKNTLEEVYEGGGSRDAFFLEFKAQVIPESKDYSAVQRILKDKIVIIFVDKVSKEESELAIDIKYLNIERSFDNYITNEVKYFYYSLNLFDVPLLMILESEQIDIRIYTNRRF